jgi:hypothetical protein
MMIVISVFGMFFFGVLAIGSMRGTGRVVMLSLIALVAFAFLSAKRPTERESLDYEARQMIQQHNAKVDRDAHELMVRIRAEQMLRGR